MLQVNTEFIKNEIILYFDVRVSIYAGLQQKTRSSKGKTDRPAPINNFICLFMMTLTL